MASVFSLAKTKPTIKTASSKDQENSLNKHTGLSSEVIFADEEYSVPIKRTKIDSDIEKTKNELSI